MHKLVDVCFVERKKESVEGRRDEALLDGSADGNKILYLDIPIDFSRIQLTLHFPFQQHVDLTAPPDCRQSSCPSSR